VNGKVEKEQ